MGSSRFGRDNFNDIEMLPTIDEVTEIYIFAIKTLELVEVF